MQLLTTVLFISLAVLVSTQASEPINEYLPPPPAEITDSGQLADDGYNYKTVRKLKYRARHRRDISQEYLPPLTQEYLPPNAENADSKLADDGYRYKTVRKLKYRARHRRDVSELQQQPINEYLPPVNVELAPDLNTIVGDDGYRYKTVRRLKYRRHRRSADEASPANEYLPPAEETEDAPQVGSAEVKSAELADDGYHYKTIRKIRYRARH